MLIDIDHVQVAIPEGGEDQARQFYGGVLGLVEIEKPMMLRGRGGLWFALGGRQLHLGVEKEFRPAAKAHPAFLVDDLRELRSRLEAGGSPVIDDEPLESCDRFFSHDPFGNRLEFLQRR